MRWGGGPEADDAGALGRILAVAISVAAIGVLPATAQWIVLRRSSLPWGSYAIRSAVGLAAGGVTGWLAGTAFGLTFPGRRG